MLIQLCTRTLCLCLQNPLLYVRKTSPLGGLPPLLQCKYPPNCELHSTLSTLHCSPSCMAVYDSGDRTGSWVDTWICIQILAFFPIGLVTLGKKLHLSEPIPPSVKQNNKTTLLDSFNDYRLSKAPFAACWHTANGSC